MTTARLPEDDDPSDATGRSDAGLMAALSLIFALAPFGIRLLTSFARYAVMLFIGGGAAMNTFDTVQFVTAWAALLTSSGLSTLAVILGVRVRRDPSATERQSRRAFVGILVGAFGLLVIVVNIVVFVLS